MKKVKPVPEIIDVITGQDTFYDTFYFPEEVVAGKLTQLIFVTIEKLIFFSLFIYAA